MAVATPTIASPTTAVGIGWSEDTEALTAGRQAAQQALRAMSAPHADLAVLFASARYDQARLLRGVRDVIGQVPLLGGSDAGEIIPGASLQRAAVLLLIHSQAMRLTVSVAEHLRAAPHAAGQFVATQCLQAHRQERRRAFVLLADGMTGASQELLRGAQEVLGASFPIVGALTGDDLLFRQTYQYYNDRVLTDSVVGLLISGQVKVGMSARHGWHPVGRPHRVTRAAGHVLSTLDDQPAAKVYEEYLGQDEVRRMQGWWLSSSSVAYPLGMSVEGEEELLLRTVVRIAEDGSLVCAGDVWEGATIRLMVGTREGAIEAARLAASQAKEGLSQVAFGLVFDSVARRRLFGGARLAELQAIQTALGAQVPFMGCYTYGEQAPLRSAMHLGRSYFHNGTALVIAVGT